MTQTQMAKLLGISQQGVSARINGHTPFTVTELFVLSEAFGIRPGVLLGEPPTPLEQAAASWGRDRGGVTAAAGGRTVPPYFLRLVPPLAEEVTPRDHLQSVEMVS